MSNNNKDNKNKSKQAGFLAVDACTCNLDVCTCNIAERNLKYEHKLANSLLNSIVENVPNMIFLKHASDLRFEFFNRAGEELLGLDRAEFIGHNDFDFFPKEQAEFFIAKDKEVLQQQGVMDIAEETIETPRGTRVLHTQKIAIRDEQGAPQYLLGISEDITERKLAEQDLRQFKSTLDQTLDCVFMFEAESLLFTYLNEGALRQVGYTRDELLCMHPFDIKPEYDEAKFREVILPLLMGELASLNFETIHQHKNGQNVPVEIFLQYFESKDERARFVAIVRDITERQRTEQALRTQAMIIDQIHDSVVSTDFNGFITSWNKGAERLFGYTSDKILGKHIASVYPEEEHDFLQNQLIPTLMESGAHEVEMRMQTKSGKVFFAQLSLSMLYDQHSNALGMICYIMDITERKLMEAELESYRGVLETQVEERTAELIAARDEAERANTAKSEFLSNMSHELRTPMNAILGFGQMLKLDADGLSETQNGNINEILEAGQHLLSLINEVLDLAKIESGNMDVSMQQVSVDDLIKQSLPLISSQAEERQLEIIDNISGKDYTILADIHRLKQVLVNLLSNAVKYNRVQGRITLDSIIMDDQRLRISVTDTGEGLTEEEIASLFTPFDRLNAANNIEGTGIGLVITRHLVELMEGNIGVESTMGEGSSFWIELALSSKK